MPLESNQTPQHSNLELVIVGAPVDAVPEVLLEEASEVEIPIEYCSLGSLFDPFIFPIGKQSFKINFDLRINLGRTNDYETVLVDCDSYSDHLVFESEFMLRFTNFMWSVNQTVYYCIYGN